MDKSDLINDLRKTLNIKESHYIYLFNNAASAYSSILLSSVLYVKLHSKEKPAFVMSLMEPPEILSTVNEIIKNDIATVSYITPDKNGAIQPAMVRNAIKGVQPSLLIVSYANPLMGTINDLTSIANVTNVPLFSDCSVLFGKYSMNINADIISFKCGNSGLFVVAMKHNITKKFAQVCSILNPVLDQKITLDPNLISHGSKSLKNAYLNMKEKNKKLLSLRNNFIKHSSGTKRSILLLLDQKIKSLTHIIAFIPLNNTIAKPYLKYAYPFHPKQFSQIGISPKYQKNIFVLHF